MEKEQIFSTRLTFSGKFPYENLYLFCYDYLKNEFGFIITEKRYKELVKGDAKDVAFLWVCDLDVTDYFAVRMEVDARVFGLKDAEIVKDGRKVKVNQGFLEIDIRGILIRDKDGKFEHDAFRKFLRAIYEKWVIPARVDEMRERIFVFCDTFFNQARAYLDLEGKRG